MNIPLPPFVLFAFQIILTYMFLQGAVLYLYFKYQFKRYFEYKNEYKQQIILKGISEGRIIMIGSAIIYLFFYGIAPLL